METAGVVVDAPVRRVAVHAPSGCRPMFDYNVAPFFQSFVEVRVERSTNRVLFVPYGVHGRLSWGDLASSGEHSSGRRDARHARSVGRADWAVIGSRLWALGYFGKAMLKPKAESQEPALDASTNETMR